MYMCILRLFHPAHTHTLHSSVVLKIRDSHAEVGERAGAGDEGADGAARGAKSAVKQVIKLCQIRMRRLL